MKYLLPFLCIALALNACKKAKIKTVTTNNSVDSLTYQPKVAGSKWTYKTYINSIPNATNITTRLSRDTVINSKSYYIFEFESEGLQFTRQDGDKYYSVLTSSTNKTELLVLDASKNVNESWVGGVNGSDTYTYTMLEKSTVFTLDGFTFKNVLKIHQQRTNGSGTVTLEGDTFYAQGIGQILSEGTISSIPITVKLIAVELK